eukprot:m.209819 g.209819  ORF g.209819 m.209819 type:complete len:50 (+) comp15477_c0_seq3:4125-4274(+)
MDSSIVPMAAPRGGTFCHASSSPSGSDRDLSPESLRPPTPPGMAQFSAC